MLQNFSSLYVFLKQMHQTLHWVQYSLNMVKMDNCIILHIVIANSLPQRLIMKFMIKELLAIINTFEKWRHLLEGAQHTSMIYMDYKNLEYFMSARLLN